MCHALKKGFYHFASLLVVVEVPKICIRGSSRDTLDGVRCKPPSMPREVPLAASAEQGSGGAQLLWRTVAPPPRRIHFAQQRELYFFFQVREKCRGLAVPDVGVLSPRPPEDPPCPLRPAAAGLAGCVFCGKCFLAAQRQGEEGEFVLSRSEYYFLGRLMRRRDGSFASSTRFNTNEKHADGGAGSDACPQRPRRAAHRGTQ